MGIGFYISIIFTKQLRDIRKFFVLLTQKIDGSKRIEKEVKKNSEFYILDTMGIEFDVINSVIRVQDHSGKIVVVENCEFSNDELQKYKFRKFSELLSFVRDEYNRRVEKQKKLQDASKKMKLTNDMRIAERKKEEMENAARAKVLDKIKSL
ncbi:MAG: hypothetical protein J5679_03230 [Alphaproteobacteria bacterium]|nr:hypothetical protein [Alphaproteobacteria bacterium]